MNRPKEIMVGSAITKIREPQIITGARVCLLLHGWTGDESSMWVFGNKISEDWLVISPRAPFQSVGAALGGYSWADQTIRQWPTYQNFFPSINFLDTLMSDLADLYPGANFTEINLIGFSQGAAMTFVYAGVKTSSIQKIALLSGFLPEGYEGYVKSNQFNHMDIFIGHGALDEIVPVSKAIESRNRFNGQCKNLVYCVSDVGHRLGSECFNALQRFMIA